MLFGSKALVDDHRVLLAGGSPFVEEIGKCADVRCAAEKLLVIHRSAGIGGKAVDVQQIDLQLEAPLRVVSELCHLHGFEEVISRCPLKTDEDVVSVYILLHGKSFYGRLKSETIYQMPFHQRYGSTRKELRAIINDYIQWYNKNESRKDLDICPPSDFFKR